MVYLYNVLFQVTIIYILTKTIVSGLPSISLPGVILEPPFQVDLPPLGSETENFKDVNYYKNRTIYR